MAALIYVVLEDGDIDIRLTAGDVTAVRKLEVDYGDSTETVCEGLEGMVFELATELGIDVEHVIDSGIMVWVDAGGKRPRRVNLSDCTFEHLGA